MVAPVVVVLNEGRDLRLKVARQEVVFEQDAVLERLVPALDLALGLGMVWERPRTCPISCVSSQSASLPAT